MSRERAPLTQYRVPELVRDVVFTRCEPLIRSSIAYDQSVKELAMCCYLQGIFDGVSTRTPARVKDLTNMDGDGI